MDIEKLTKHQIVLLTLLVSFVTSIATGVVTVSLMDQAPPSVSRTINEIVEHTVETVAPSTTPAAVAATQKTVVVKDDDVAAQSIAAVQKSIIHIVAKGDDQLIARGVIIDQKGAAITDQGALTASSATSFEAILADGERVPLSIPTGQSTTTPILTIDVAVGTSTGFAPAPLADPSKLQLGQSMIRIGGVGTDIVGEGVLAELPQKGDNALQASVSSATPGSVLITLFGEVVGLATTDSMNNGADFYTLAQAQVTSAATSTTATQSSAGS